MFALFLRTYDAVDPVSFNADLNNKSHVVLLLDDTGALRGFSSLQRYVTRYQAEEFQIVFSGDTVIDRAFWGEQALPEAWLRLVGSFKAERPTRKLMWFLIVKGHRTYRYLSLYARHYHPSPSADSPADLRPLLDQLATERFGEHYDATTGLVRFTESRGHLAPGYDDVPAGAARRPEARHFLALNPGHARGDELACLTELSLENLRPRARRQFAAGLIP